MLFYPGTLTFLFKIQVSNITSYMEQTPFIENFKDQGEVTFKDEDNNMIRHIRLLAHYKIFLAQADKSVAIDRTIQNDLYDIHFSAKVEDEYNSITKVFQLIEAKTTKLIRKLLVLHPKSNIL